MRAGLDLDGAASLAAAVRSGRVSAVEVVEATLARIAEAQARTHAFVTVLADTARAEAAAVDAAVARNAAGPLAGVPVAVKDLFAVRGVVRGNGSPVFANDPGQPHDATAVARLRAAGAIVVGTTHMHEMALGPTGVNLALGTAVNPWGRDRVPGGSSSGSGVAVAAGLVPVALGSDTGGSIRIPAAFNGVTGLKPTYGRVSRAGATALAWSLDHVGPITRSVEDAALVLQAIAGADSADLAAAPLPVPDYRAGLGRSIGGWRIGVPRDVALSVVDPEVAMAFEAALAVLRAAGADVRDVAIDGMRESQVAFAGTILAEAAASLHGTLQARVADASLELQMFARLGSILQAAHLVSAQRQRTRFFAAIGRVLDEVDVLALPTAICLPPRHDEMMLRLGEVEKSAMEAIAWLTWPFNFAGLPAISVPCGWSRDGLPIGLQLAGRAFAEGDVLTAAAAYQARTDWHRRRPAAA